MFNLQPISIVDDVFVLRFLHKGFYVAFSLIVTL